MSPSPSKDPLSGLLAQWRITPTHNAHFRSNVWSRIEAGNRQPATWSAFARAHSGLVAAVVTASMLVGAWTGLNEAREHRDAERQAIAASYVHTLDARWMRNP